MLIKDKHGLYVIGNKRYCPDQKNCGCHFPDIREYYISIKPQAIENLSILKNAIKLINSDPAIFERMYRSIYDEPKKLTYCGHDLISLFDKIEELFENIK